ncbi:MAG TPA: DinB family protein [Candidatus Methylomirabilis sp.]|nr:DinB family protein [Candidatus Methylomirabilis sp.]
MQHHLPDTIALLSRTPAALNAFLRDLPDAWTHGNEGENTWNPFEIVAHLIHAERTAWIPRAKMILELGETRTFAALERAPKDQERAQPLALLLDQFAFLRSENLAELRALNLRQEDLQRRGRHPVFGPVTLSQLLATWATHDLTHLHQISRVMAHQYRQTVGPFSAYLGVLQCAGHSAPA